MATLPTTKDDLRDLLRIAAELGSLRHHRAVDRLIEYGTAGFRTKSDLLDHVMYRMGLLAVIRSKFKRATIGVMITASHNPEEDNGVKLIDPNGEMLESSWEVHATRLANVKDADLSSVLHAIITETGTDLSQPSNVVIARDTRSSSPSLSKSVEAGVKALQSQLTDYGILTTPQLHYMVRCINSNGAYGVPSVVGYYKKISDAFIRLNKPVAGTIGKYEPKITVDGANGVGALKLKEMMSYLDGILSVVICNDGSTGRLNEKCGADYVKVQQKSPEGWPAVTVGARCASFDGDADRIVYFFTDKDKVFRLLDGDKIATLVCGYLGELVSTTGIAGLSIAVVQTAYANGASTDYIANVAKVPGFCVPTGVKHLHHKAQEFDIGVYFEANGHGTVLFKDSAVQKIKHVLEDSSSTDKMKEAADRLLATVDLINQTVGDSISDMLLVETVLRYRDWDIDTWNSAYTDLPSRQLKVSVADRGAIETTDAERVATKPVGLQSEINSIVSKYERGRSFVRPSGTEDVVRVYAEATTQVDADKLAKEVSQAVYVLAGGIGDH